MQARFNLGSKRCMRPKIIEPYIKLRFCRLRNDITRFVAHIKRRKFKVRRAKMSGPWIKRLSDQAADKLHDATNGVFRQMRIGDMALLAVHHQTTRQRPATTDFDHIA
jgi:hypothetical protein